MKTSLLIREMLTFGALILATSSVSAQMIDSNFDLSKIQHTEEAADSSPSSPPLATDDPGTPGSHGFEIALILDCDVTSSDNSCESVVNAAFGIGSKTQFRVSRGYTRQAGAGQTTLTGLGATDVGVKYRFVDKNGLRLAIFPALRLNDATRQTSLDGSLLPTAGTSIYLPLIVSKQVGGVTVIANVGRRINFSTSEQNSTFTSLAVGHATGRTSKAMVEIASEASSSDRRTDFRIGWAKNISPKSWRSYQANFFTSYGQSLRTSADGKIHRTLLVGVSIARQPR